MKKYQVIGRYVSWIITLSAVVYLVYRLITYDEYDSLAHLFRQADAISYGCLSIALFLLPIQIHVELIRWQILLQGIQTITLRDSLRQVMAGYLGAFITPYRLGEYPARLLQAGLDQSLFGSQWNWRTGLLNGQKWLQFGLLTLARYCVWGCQLWAVLRFCGIPLTFTQAVVSIGMYYVILTFAPSLPAAEVPMKGGWAVLLFSPYTSNMPAILVAVTLIWLINTILPVIFASVLKKL